METERRINAARYVGMAYPWTQAVSEYLARFDAEGLRDASRYQAQNALRLFAESCFPRTAEDITQWAIDHYTAQRRAAGVSLWTVRKELGVLRTFVNWMAARGLHAESIVWPKIRVEAPVKRALTTNEIRRLLAACHTPTWRMRVLLSLCTGLRSSDVDALRVSAIDWDAGAIDTTSRKTRKTRLQRPLPDALMPHLRAYVDGLDPADDRLLPDRNVRYAWFDVRERAELPKVTQQDLRVTFSTLIQALAAEHSAVRLLEHCDARVTRTFYSDADLLDKLRVNLLPVEEWLLPEGVP